MDGLGAASQQTVARTTSHDGKAPTAGLVCLVFLEMSLMLLLVVVWGSINVDVIAEIANNLPKVRLSLASKSMVRLVMFVLLLFRRQ